MKSNKETQYVADMIRQAKSCDSRGDAAGRNRAVSQLRSDSELPKPHIDSALRNAGLIR